MITLNVCDGTAQEAMAWVAFCRGRIGDKRVIGRDKNGVDWKTVDYWAQKRLEETGLYAPVDVVYWELGNECVGGPRFSGKEFSTATDYSPVARAFARKIRQIDQSVSLGWIAWDDKVMGKETDLMDFFIIHHYAGLPVYGDKIMMWNTETLTGTFQCPEAGEYAVEVRLASNGVTPEVIKANKIPEVKLGIDGKVLKTVTLQPDYETVRLNAQLASGEHRVEVTFTNDYSAAGGIDTNVEVAKRFTVTRGEKNLHFTFSDKDTNFCDDLKTVQTMLTNHTADFNKRFPHAFTAITEFNRMESSCYDLKTALYVAEFLRICAQSPRVLTTEVWEACSWNFGIFKCSDHFPRPVYFTYMMMKELLDRQIPVSGLSDEDSVRILATRNSMGTEVAILIINLKKTDRTVQVSLAGGKRLLGCERQGISGPALTIDNESGLKIKLQTQPLSGEVQSIEVLGYSVTLIRGEIKN
jgi:hypothetical protein